MVSEQQEEEAAYLSNSYKIDPKTMTAQGRSLQLLLLHRRCATCWGTLIQEPAQGMNIDAAKHIERIARHCSTAPDFIHSELPVMEAVFRILLSNGNKSMTLESIYETLRERWLDSTTPRTPLPEKLYRLVSHDAFYGITQVPQTTEKGKS
ncbi:MAG: hypothetical protein V3S37_07785 [Dehalococcoidia bacterium]